MLRAYDPHCCPLMQTYINFQSSDKHTSHIRVKLQKQLDRINHWIGNNSNRSLE